MTDPRRLIPRTDVVMTDPRLVTLSDVIGRHVVKAATQRVLDAMRAAPSADVSHLDVAGLVADRIERETRPAGAVFNATGVVLHTNLGRAPLGQAAVAAAVAAAGYIDVEYDLHEGRRARRGRTALAALRAAVPDAQDVLVVNNGAAALSLAMTALAAGREVVVARGELVEIGDGFRLPDLISSTGVTLREIGTTNRVTLSDYRAAVPGAAAVLKVHPGNFELTGFTGAVAVDQVVPLGLPVVVDVGSGLLRPHPILPDEPDVTTTLRAGADLVTCSGDKLLGGPQAGLVFGRADLIERLRRHPLARAMRVDKLTLAALEATLADTSPPAWRSLLADADRLRYRCDHVAARLAETPASNTAVAVEVVPSEGRVGGGSAPGVTLPGWAVALPADLADPLRRGRPAVVGRLHGGRLLLDLRCVPPLDDDALVAAVRAAIDDRAAG